MKDKWKFYKDVGEKWRWRRTAANGNIVGASTEGYSNKSDCKGNARRNGWRGRILFRTKDEYVLQNIVHEENKEIDDKAAELFTENGIKAGNDFILWIQAERELGERSRARYYRKLRNILFLIAVFLCVIAAVLVFILLKKKIPLRYYRKRACLN
jgi:uncharacterized protein YegP (UPF0339 family)